MRFEVPTLVTVKITVCWDVMLHCLVDCCLCSMMKMEATHLPKILVPIYHTAQSHDPEDHNVTASAFP
jgi:hypothetical protein